MFEYLTPGGDAGLPAATTPAEADVSPPRVLYGSPDTRIAEWQETLKPMAEAGLLSRSWSGADGAGAEAVLRAAAGIYKAPGGSENVEYRVLNVFEGLNTYVTVEVGPEDAPDGVSELVMNKVTGFKYLYNSYNESANVPAKAEPDPNAALLMYTFQSETPLTAKGELFQLAAMLFAPGEKTGFASASDLTSGQLTRFYVNLLAADNARLQELYDEGDGYYHVNFGEAVSFIQGYFSGAQIDPQEAAKSVAGAFYLAGTNELLLPGNVAYAPHAPFYQITQEAVISSDTVALTADRLSPSGDSVENTGSLTLDVKIVDGGYRFLAMNEQ
jgi:hypothetical protein